MKKHLIIATYDGIGTHYSGVGTIAKNIITSLATLTKDSDLKVSIAYVNVDKESKVFNSECYNAAYNLVTGTGGQLIPLCNSTKGQSEWDMWRSFDEWNFTCISLVSVLNLILEERVDNLILLNDTPFLFFARYRKLVVNQNLRCLYFPLSTGKNHAFGHEGWRTNRIRVERDCFQLINEDHKSKIISLGRRFAERMRDDYGLNFADNDYLQNGLCFDKYADFLDRKFGNSALLQYEINLDENEKIIFAWGRCSIAKGFTELAKAWKYCFEQLPNHRLILQMPNNSGEEDYFLEVKAILQNTQRATVIDDFNPNIWKTILRNENTVVVCIPSLMDPFPHTAIEAKLFSLDMNYITVISEIDGAIDAFSPDESIYVDPRETKEFAQKILEAATIKNKDRRTIIDKNKESINQFNFRKIFARFLKENFSDEIEI